MHVGMAVIFQGYDDPARDREVYARELALADQAEGLGFESIWAVEHHFTAYTMCPDPLQFLTYMAGRTKNVKLGSMVVVLPWHDPVRVAEHVSMLDMLSDGRFIFGVGRGLGRVEFDGFRIPMDEARSRFIESATAVLEGLDRGYLEFSGEHFQIPRRELRPAPMASFRGRTYAAAVSPESVKIMAELGVGLLIIPQKPWAQVSAELDEYKTQYRLLRGEEPPAPIVAGWTFVDNDAKRAKDMAHQYMGGYYETVMDHYEFAAGHLAKQKGYEFYGKLTENLDKHGKQGGIDFFTDLQVWGTPDMCLEKIEWIKTLTGAETYIAVCSYAGLEAAEADRNLKQVASDVMPTLKSWSPVLASV